MSPAPLQRRLFRRHTTRLVISLLYSVGFIYFAIFALAIGPGAPPTSRERLVYALLSLPFLALMVRTFRIAVITEPAGVRVRGVMRTRRIPWGDVDAFVMGDWGGFDCGAVRRRDGSEAIAFALNPPLQFGNERVPRMEYLLSELNGELERARALGLASAPASGRPAAPPAPRTDPNSTLF